MADPFIHKSPSKHEGTQHSTNDWEMSRREQYNYLEFEDNTLIILEDDSCNFLILEDSFET